MRLLELYSTVQGEGPRTGEPTQFVRFAGCNLRCPGWPCDTQHAIEPELWKPVAQVLSGEEVAMRVPVYPRNVCITGGEPLLQRTVDMQEFIEALLANQHTIEIFTNGTQPIPQSLIGKVRFMMDWKLPGSGELLTEDEQDIRTSNAHRLHPLDGIKFVVVDVDDLLEALNVWQRFQVATDDVARPQFWLGAVWGRIKDEELVKFILDHKLPWKLNVQQHKYIWDPNQQGV